MDEKINSGVLVGLSGGADSVLLLVFLLEYRKRYNKSFSIVCCHVNHGIRSEEADRDEMFCEKLCESLGVCRRYHISTRLLIVNTRSCD